MIASTQKERTTFFWSRVERCAASNEFLEHLILLVLLKQGCDFRLYCSVGVALFSFHFVEIMRKLIGKLLEGSLDQEGVRWARHVVRCWLIESAERNFYCARNLSALEPSSLCLTLGVTLTVEGGRDKCSAAKLSLIFHSIDVCL